MSLKPFFVVWNPATGYTKFKHPTQEAADKEAERLARENRNSEFLVMAPVARFKAVDVTKEKFDYYLKEEDIPF